VLAGREAVLVEKSGLECGGEGSREHPQPTVLGIKQYTLNRQVLFVVGLKYSGNFPVPPFPPYPPPPVPQ